MQQRAICSLAMAFMFVGTFPLDLAAQASSLSQQNNRATIVESTCPDHNPDCRGKIVWSDGSYYEGEIRNGAMDGAGKMTYADGNIYEGNWENNQKVGEGALLFANGDEYFGNFKDDQIEGEGNMIYSDGRAYSGEWKTGEREGNGTQIRSDKSQYRGQFKDGQRNGAGEIIWESGDTLSGIWLDNQLDGKSTYHFSNGDQLTCSWKLGNLNVRGIYRFANGKEIKGSLKKIRQEANESLELLSDTEGNFQKAWLGFALEFKENHDYDLATDFLLSAQNFADDEMEEYSEKIAAELEQIRAYKGTNFARLPLSLDPSN